MNTKQTVILYSLIGAISLALSYITFSAAKMSSYIPENNYQGVLILVAACMLVLGILFFIPVATGLVLLSEKKTK